MEVKQTPAAKRGNLKSRERLPLQDKTNILSTEEQNNAMVRKVKPRLNLVNTDMGSETIEQDSENKNVLNDRKNQPQPRGVARGAKKLTEGARLVEKPGKSEVTTSARVSRSRTRHDSDKAAEERKINENLTAKKGRKVDIKGDSNSKSLSSERDAILRDIEHRSSFVSLEKNIEDVVKVVKDRNVSDKCEEPTKDVGKSRGNTRNSKIRKAGEVLIEITPGRAANDAKMTRGANMKTGKITTGLHNTNEKSSPKMIASKYEAALQDIELRSSFVSLDRSIEKIILEAVNNGNISGKNTPAPIIPEKNQPNRRNAIISKTIATTATTSENNQTKTKPAKKQTKILEFVTKDTTRFLRPKKPPKDTAKTNSAGKSVPVYKQIRTSPESFVKDVYDFDSDSEDVNKRKRKKTKASIGYDKDMDEVVKKLDKKFKKTTRKRPAAKKEKPIPKNSRKAIPTTSGNEIPTTSRRGRPPTSRKGVLTSSGKEVPTISRKEVPTTSGKEIPTTSGKMILTTSGKEIPTTSGREIPTTSQKEILTTSRIPCSSQKSIPDISIQKVPVDTNSDSKQMPTVIIDDYEEPEMHNVTSKVSAPDEMFDFEEPVANSTMLNMTRNDPQASPWRSNLNVIRNPHFLQFKDSFLPNYNQEMVLDSSIVERTAPKSFEKTWNKSPKQASILNYIDGKEIEIRTVNSTLFDDNQFSPIKEKTKEKLLSESKKKSLLESRENSLSESVNSADKENSFEVKQKKRVDRAKRNILGPVVDNQQIVGNSPGILGNSSGIVRKSPGISDCFGFDDSVDVVEDRNDKPVRMDTFVKVIRRENPVCQDVSDVEDSSVKMDENAGDKEIGLFEDYQPDRTLEYSQIRQYAVKKRRQRRCRSPSPYTDSDDEEHHHRKKRNKRTKKEDDEAEKWAAAFNSMCEEVEKFPLEIE